MPVTVDPYRCRGSITHGTAAAAGGGAPSVKPMTTATPMLRHAGAAAVPPPVPALAARSGADDAPWSKKPTCVVNGLCWTAGGQTLPSVAARPLSPPSKVDLISQGLVPNPLYSSAAGGGGPRGAGADVLPRLAVAGIDYAVDMSAKRTSARVDAPPPAVNTCPEAPPTVKRGARCESEWPPPAQGGQAPGPGSSYMDSFRSFVDHAVQSAFMDDSEKERNEDAGAKSATAAVGLILRTLTASPRSRGVVSQSDPVAAVVTGSGNEPGKMGVDQPSWVSQSDPGLAVAGCSETARKPGTVQSLSSPSQMPSLVASVSTAAAASPSGGGGGGGGPPLLVPQCPLDAAAEDPRGSSPALSTGAAGSERAVPGRSDTDSETLSAHSPAPLLLPAAATPPPPANAASSSLHLKKTWLLRYSDEDRKNSTTTAAAAAGAGAETSRPGPESYEKPQEGAGVDEKSPSTDWTAKQKQNGAGSGNEASAAAAAASESDAKASKPGPEKPPPRQDAPGKKGANRAIAGNCRETAEDGGKLAADGKEASAAGGGGGGSIKNCFINCTYLSSTEKEQDARALRRARDSTTAAGLTEDKDAQSSTSKESSDDSQVWRALTPSVRASNMN